MTIVCGYTVEPYANLWGANLSGANLNHADLWGANLEGADLWGADLDHAVLNHADLSGADLNHAVLNHAVLSGANLNHAVLNHAVLNHADLRDAILRDADLRGANLDGANLDGADMWGCVGDGQYIVSVQAGRYPVTYTANAMQIGCQRHPIEAWWGFTDQVIDSMGPGHALDWWKIWKPILRQIIAVSPAKSASKPEDENS